MYLAFSNALTNSGYKLLYNVCTYRIVENENPKQILLLLKSVIYRNITCRFWMLVIESMLKASCALSPAFQRVREFDGLEKAVAAGVANTAVPWRLCSKVQPDHWCSAQKQRQATYASRMFIDKTLGMAGEYGFVEIHQL